MNLGDVATIVGIGGGLIGIGTTVVIVARYFSRTTAKFSKLDQQLEALRQQNDSLRRTLTITPDGKSTRAYERLRELASDAARALDASYHSISVADPPKDPTHLKIILSTDPAAAKIVGRRFPANQGLSGAVFQRQIAEKSAQLLTPA